MPEGVISPMALESPVVRLEASTPIVALKVGHGESSASAFLTSVCPSGPVWSKEAGLVSINNLSPISVRHVCTSWLKKFSNVPYLWVASDQDLIPLKKHLCRMYPNSPAVFCLLFNLFDGSVEEPPLYIR